VAECRLGHHQPCTQVGSSGTEPHLGPEGPTPYENEAQTKTEYVSRHEVNRSITAKVGCLGGKRRP